VPAISFNQVGKRYPGGHEALAGVTLAVERGEMVFLTGHSGAGKSTLLKLIPAIERPTHGVILVNDQNVGRMRAAAIPYLRRNLGLVFQDQKLLRDRTAFENVMLPLAAAGLPPRAALDKVRLLHRERTRPIALSAGSSSGFASRERSSTGRAASSPTSRPPISTPISPSSSWRWSATSTASASP